MRRFIPMMLMVATFVLESVPARAQVGLVDELAAAEVVASAKVPCGETLKYTFGDQDVFSFLRQWLGGGPSKVDTQGVKGKTKYPTFADVAGVDGAKAELAEVVAYLRDASSFHEIGARMPRGILLSGPPGTGKTLLARALANEANAQFFAVNGSSLVLPYIGQGSQAVHDLFRKARSHAPAVIFIDEIDGIGAKRGGAEEHREIDRILNQLLVEMDGFDPLETILVVAATNRPETLDPALVRAGRLERKVEVGLPDVRGRAAILAVCLKRVAHARDLSLTDLARSCPGFSGADLASWTNEAALTAYRAGRKFATMEDFHTAWERMVLGAATGHVMTAQQLEVTAHHEAGHALVATLLPEADPVSQATIVSRGRNAGSTAFEPTDNGLSYTSTRLMARLTVAMGGRAAERMVYGKLTDGSSSDLQQATRLATLMVRILGMSDAVGPVFYDDALRGNHSISAATAERIDLAVAGLLIDAEARASELLEENAEALYRIAAALTRYETISGDEVRMMAAGHALARPSLSAPQVEMDGRLLPSTAPAIELQPSVDGRG